MVGVRQRYLIYDGDCGLCEACIGYAARYARYNCSHRAHRTGSQDDPKGRFSLRPYQSFSVEGLAALGLTAADCSRAVQVVTADGRLLAGARGINYFLRQRWVGLLFNLFIYAIPPLFLLELLLYRLVANNRRWLSTRLGLTACYYEPSIWQPDGGDTATKQTD
jgi:predicted DCC family thiol-disulfide oxidoreductase YuxK